MRQRLNCEGWRTEATNLLQRLPGLAAPDRPLQNRCYWRLGGGVGESGEASLALQQAEALVPQDNKLPHSQMRAWLRRNSTDVVAEKLFGFFYRIAFGDPVGIEVIGKDQYAQMGETHIAHGEKGWADIGTVRERTAAAVEDDIGIARDWLRPVF